MATNYEELTLAKALSVKNRLAGRLAQSRTNIETYNSVLEGRRRAGGVDVRAELERFQKLQHALVTVKAAIQHANDPIYADILRLGEIKSQLQLLNGLNTTHGAEPGFNGVELLYDAAIKKPEILHMVRALEGEIDTTQDRINQHNASTQIELPSEILDLAR